MALSEQHTIQNERDLILVAPKNPGHYQGAALTSLTAYSMFWLHRWQLPRTIEAIAVLSWRLFPDKFSMVGYPEYPDAFRTNRSLLQMQPKYRNLLTGAASKGFSLNANGMQVAEELTTAIGPPAKGDGKSLGTFSARTSLSNKRPARSIEPDREVGRLRESKLFEKWRTGVMSERDLIHVHSLLGIFDHTPTSVRQRAMKDLERNAQKLGDKEAEKFLTEVRNLFPQALSR